VTEEQLQEIEAFYCAMLPQTPFIGQLRVQELLAEVRRLRDQNKALDPYGRGVVTRATTF
jgi:hypothetical protein